MGNIKNRQIGNVIKILKEKGEEAVDKPKRKIDFTGCEQADDFVNDIDKYPHAFVLGCVMDRRIKTERAWRIPYEISKEVKSKEFSKFANLGLKKVKRIFKEKELHVYKSKMPICFWSAIERIRDKYEGVASRIWTGNPKSGTVVRRFLLFHGVGPKIASMSTNILNRDFKVRFADRFCIDISPDRHVRRVFYRLGLTYDEGNKDETIYLARELNPEYPGVFDLYVWELGKKICVKRDPKCDECDLNSYCPRKGV